MGLRRGLGNIRSLQKGHKVIIHFAPSTPTGSGTATFPTWQATVVYLDDDALVVELDGKEIALSWDHIAGLQVV